MSERVRFPILARPWGPREPLRSMQPEGGGPLWRETLNAYVNRGVLRRRDGLVDDIKNTAAFTTAATTLNDGTQDAQYVKKIICSPAATGNAGTKFLPALVIVTSKEMFYQSAGGAAKNITPVYSAGAVSVADQSKNVLGAGTVWKDRNIYYGQYIELPADSGDWYRINTVTDNTNLVLQDNYEGAGVDLVAGQYNIRRSFYTSSSPPGDSEGYCPSPFTRPVFSQVFNNDLYLCGNLCTERDQDTVVLRVKGVFDDAVNIDHTRVEFLFGGYYEYSISTDASPTAGTALDYLSSDFRAQGMTVLQDGRVVLAGQEAADLSGFNTADVYASRVRYSSHLDPTVWTTSPAGAVDLVSEESGITGLGRMGETLTVHHSSGIVLGDLTGNAFYPFQWRDSLARLGTYAPNAIVRLGGMEVFPAHNFTLQAFDGNSVKEFDPSFREWAEYNEIEQHELFAVFGTLLNDRDEAFFCFPVPPELSTGTNNRQVDNGQGLGYIASAQGGWKVSFEQPITAVEGRFFAEVDSSDAGYRNYYYSPKNRPAGVVGGPFFDSSNAPLSPLLVLRPNDDDDLQDTGDDEYPGATGDFSVQTDDLDYGVPELRKIVDTIHITYEDATTATVPTNTILVISVQYDGGTWEDKSVTLTKNAGGFATAHFSQKSGHKYRIKLSTTAASKMSHALVSMVAMVSMVGSEPAS